MIKSTLIKNLILAFSIMLCASCIKNEGKTINFPETNLEIESMIPKPLKVTSTHSAFGLDKYTKISTSNNNTQCIEISEFLANKIALKTSLEIPINQEAQENTGGVIFINQLNNSDSKSPESYQLNITKDSIILNSTTAEGAFRGIQTIRQIIPEISNDTLSEQKIWVIPSGTITDSPNFAYRGSMLDVARHFFSVKDVKKYIDHLAYYKINKLHLHLSDDQGWRIEIKSWPKLTEIGGSTEVGGESGGFYTQEEYKDIVAYAAKHFITIIPEIDMPGHTNAASVSYPFLNGNGKKLTLYEGTQVGFSTFDTKKDTVYAFIDDVIRELSAINPGPYMHIGGDESHVTKKEDFNYFISKVSKIVKKHGKRMIGWDEIVHADIDSNAIAQFWNNEKNAIEASKKGLKVILSPGKKAYLDMKYDDKSEYGLHWAGYIPVDTAYVWTPEKYVKGLPKDAILGIEAPLWSETISNITELEYLAFPRIIGYSELGWTTEENRDWENYKIRLANQVPYLERMNINFYRSSLIDWKK